MPGDSATLIALANQKGGVGKTTTAVNLGHALAQSGHRTLIVDIDPQASATLHLGLDPVALEEAEATVRHALMDEVAFADIVTPASDELPLFTAGASLSLSVIDIQLASEPGGMFVLREKMAPVLGDYAVILIDCPPQLGYMTMNGLAAADWVLIPTQTERLSLMGIPLLVSTIEKVRRRGNPDLKFLGLLPTMHVPRQVQDRASLDELHEQWGGTLPIFQEILRTTVYPQSAAAGRPTLEVEPRALGIEAYRALADAVVRLTRQDDKEANHGGS